MLNWSQLPRLKLVAMRKLKLFVGGCENHRPTPQHPNQSFPASSTIALKLFRCESAAAQKANVKAVRLVNSLMFVIAAHVPISKASRGSGACKNVSQA